MISPSFHVSASQNPNEELLGHAKLPTLYNRRLQDTVVLIYKVTHGLPPICISDRFAWKNSTHALRNCDFAVTRFNTIRYGKHSIRYIDPFLWSKDLKESPNVATFRNKIRKLNLSGYLSNNSNCCNLCGQQIFHQK